MAGVNPVDPPVVSALIAAGGRGVRLGAGQPKQFIEIAGQSILERSIERFATQPSVSEVVVALPPEHLEPMTSRLAALGWSQVRCVEGGPRRQDSVENAFRAARPDATVLAIHDAARPFVPPAVIDRTIAAAVAHGAAIAALPVRDTVKQAGGSRGAEARPIATTLAREDIFLAQTPQAFRREVLARAFEVAHAEGLDVTDEAMLAERAGFAVHLVEGDAGNVKITTSEDLAAARARLERATESTGLVRIGTGYDLHRLAAGRPLILGGVTIPFELGLVGHSDADILCHAVTDAVLGAAAAGDIGRLFPDTDPAWKGADSIKLLEGATAQLRHSGYRVVNVDATVIAQRPKLVPYLDAMRANLARALGVSAEQVSVKGKTNEGVDSAGRGEAMACHAVALVARASIDD
ncbi:MAG TPA: 2-C-methyl-D-erythritol 4-phosphate cytidylyltransferase [Vicinamibacterales bacterium]|nr:2-C-methyl-D-erythritol 4-phosphate cytidylyltransferase [Vicinamibacterales bacterium]